jgi:hemerythrin-like domain-containing protein
MGELLPIDALIWEHRLIERMLLPMKKEMSKMSQTKEVDSGFIDALIDFIRAYVDGCHHGKEESILFRELAKRKLANGHAEMMKQLVREHVYARATTRNLEKAKESYAEGNPESLKDVLKSLKDLAELYPKHIEKEDTKFFHPSMEYFTAQEQEAMLQEFWEFDRKMIHEKYKKALDEMEKMTPNQPQQTIR